MYRKVGSPKRILSPNPELSSKYFHAIDVATSALRTEFHAVELVLSVVHPFNATCSQDHKSCLVKARKKCTHLSLFILLPTILLTGCKIATGYSHPKTEPEDDPDDVLFSVHYGVRTIQLNRPGKLNSLNDSMVRKIIPRLKVQPLPHLLAQPFQKPKGLLSR